MDRTVSSETETPNQFETLYRAWRYARAQWDLAENDPGKPEGLSEQEDEAHADAEHRALLALLFHPTGDPDHLARKLRVVRDEHAWQFSEAAEIFEHMCGDAGRLLMKGER